MENIENNHRSSSVGFIVYGIINWFFTIPPHLDGPHILWGEWQVGTFCTGLWPGQ